MLDDNPFSSLNLVGGRRSLNFANTMDAYDPPIGEMLHGYDDLVWWALHAGVLDEEDALPLFERARREPEAAAAVFARAVRLREAIFRVLAAASRAEAMPEEHLDVVNAELAVALRHLRVRPENVQCGWVWEPADELDRVIWPLVRDAADLLVSGELIRVGKCEGEECDWMYLDTSRNRSRRWCDMASCGNRAKAKRHYHRAKSGAGD